MTTRLIGFIAALLTLFTVALSTGASIYYLLAFMLLGMLVLSFLSAFITLFTARIASRFPAQRVTRGDEAFLSFSLSHLCPLPVAFFEVQLATPQDILPMRVRLSAPPFRAVRAERKMPCPHRGVFEVGVSSVATQDVFGLFRFSRRMKHTMGKIEVSPRVHTIEPLPLDSADADSLSRTRMTEDMSSPADVRPYREGDVLKKVHWKLSMRKRELIVRTYEESVKPDTLILMATQPLTARPMQALTLEDALCETAAAVAMAQLRAGYPARMPLMSSSPSEPSGKSEPEFSRFLHALTQLTFDCPHSFEQILQIEMRRMQRTGGVVLITPRMNVRIADTAMQMRRAGMKVCVYWITDSRHTDTMALLARLTMSGVLAQRIDPMRIADMARRTAS